VAVVGEDLLEPGRQPADRPVPGQVLQVGDGEEGVDVVDRGGVAVVVLLDRHEPVDGRVTGDLDDVRLLAPHDLHGDGLPVLVGEGDSGGGHEADPALGQRLRQGSERRGVEAGVLVGERVALPPVVVVGLFDVANRRTHRPSLNVGAATSTLWSSSRAPTAHARPLCPDRWSPMGSGTVYASSAGVSTKPTGHRARQCGPQRTEPTDTECSVRLLPMCPSVA